MTIEMQTIKNHKGHEGVIIGRLGFERCRECDLRARGSKFIVVAEGPNALSFSPPQVIYEGGNAALAIRMMNSTHGSGSIKVLP